MNMMDKSMEPSVFSSHHMVKSEDINHHGTLYAGRASEWFVEAGFVAAASLTNPDDIVCSQIHNMKFNTPIHCGEIVCVDSKVVMTGRSRIVTYLRIGSTDKIKVEGFITFIHVDKQGKSSPHGVEITPITEEDKALFQRASELFK